MPTEHPDAEFEAARQAKIAEIGRTGKTWQWPDTVQHPRWTRAHLTAVGLVVAAVVVLILAVTYG